jgi:hypothetical protein
LFKSSSTSPETFLIPFAGNTDISLTFGTCANLHLILCTTLRCHLFLKWRVYYFMLFFSLILLLFIS